MKLQFYPKHSADSTGNRGFSAEEVHNGHMWVYADITCPHCGKVQPVAVTLYFGGPCCKCGKLTGIESEDENGLLSGLKREI